MGPLTGGLVPVCPPAPEPQSLPPCGLTSSRARAQAGPKLVDEPTGLDPLRW